MLESIYRAAGLRVELFTSPHLVSFRERIQVNRQLIPERRFVRLVEELRAVHLANLVSFRGSRTASWSDELRATHEATF
jgi:folylpolyglutamate synthase/dihydropteroate synthase